MKNDTAKISSNVVGEAVAENTLFRKILDCIKGSTVAKVYLMMLGVYVVSCIIQPNYLSGVYLEGMLVMASILGFLAIGQTVVILTGGIDLSIIWIMNLAAVIICAYQFDGKSDLLAIITVLVVSIVIGVFNGIGVAFFEVPPMVMTLATQSILASVTMVYTDGNAKGVAPEWLRWISVNYTFGIRNVLLLWGFVTALMWFLLSRTVFGRRLYAMGNSTNVSFLSGVNNSAMLIIVYILSSLAAALSGLIYTGYLGYSYLGMGKTYELPSIAAVVIGGTSILGGKGSYIGTVAGAIILYILTGLLNNLSMDESSKKIIYGAIILIVLLVYNREKKIKS
ncbi:MAG: ABC transporter permease [Flexilinea sp.]